MRNNPSPVSKLIKSLKYNVMMLFVVVSAQAQNSSFGNWMSYSINGKFNENWAVMGDYQWRNYNAFTDLQQVLLRTYLQYAFNERVSIGAGYAFAVNGAYSDGIKSIVSEQRPTQQAIIRWKTPRSQFILRARSEQRFIGSEDPLFRFRLFGAVLWKIKSDSRVALTATEEIFWYANDSGFDQNRLFAGLSYRFNDHLRVESGLLTISKKTSERYQLFTQLVHTFDW